MGAKLSGNLFDTYAQQISDIKLYVSVVSLSLKCYPEHLINLILWFLGRCIRIQFRK